MVKVLTLPIIAIIVAAACVRLGVWQLDRLDERKQRNALYSERLTLPPIDLATGDLPDSLHFRRAFVTGMFDYSKQVVVVARTLGGAPGVRIVTPLVLPDGRAVLVERGWTYSPDGRRVDLDRLAEADSTAVAGILLAEHPARIQTVAAGSDWPIYVRSPVPRVLQSRFPYVLSDFVFRRTTPSAGAPDGLRVVPLPAFDEGPHLSYAIQWFSFAVIAIVGTAALAYSSMKRQDRSDERA